MRTLAQSCNFCTCLEKTLLRDRVVLGIRDNSVRKKLLQERNLTLAKALDICRSSETTSKQLQNMTSLNRKSADHESKQLGDKAKEIGTSTFRDLVREGVASIVGEFMNLIRTLDKKSCNNCGLCNHFSKVCQKKRKETTRPIKQISKEICRDSGDSVYTISVSPEFTEDEEVLAMQMKHKQYKSRILAVMNIKGGREMSFQVDTGATCNMIKRNELVGIKYMKKVKRTKQVLKMYNSSTLKPIGQCMVQLRNPETHKKYKVKFTVINGENRTNLLGSRAAQQMGLVNVNYDNMKILTEPCEMKVAAVTASEPSPTEDSTPKQKRG